MPSINPHNDAYVLDLLIKKIDIAYRALSDDEAREALDTIRDEIQGYIDDYKRMKWKKNE